MILSNRGLVYTVVFALARTVPQVRKEQEEMLAVGMLALVRASDTWPRSCYPFSTWASLNISTDVRRYANRYAGAVTCPNWKKASELPRTVRLEDLDGLKAHEEEDDPAPDLSRILDLLTPDQLRCVALHYGLGGGKALGYNEIAAATGWSRHRVAYLLKLAFNQLRGQATQWEE